MSEAKRYVLLTAAKNEEKSIGLAIRSVIAQTVRPEVWCIADDGSTDRTAAIIQEYADDHPFIRRLSLEKGQQRSFGAQYRAINRAYSVVCDLAFDFVAVQDADISFECDDYYEQVLTAFRSDARIGIAGGYIHEFGDGRWRPRRTNSPDAVAGGIQMFRRACFEQIGGYSPLLYGGEDWLAQIDARRAGWQVRALTILAAHHHRPTSTAEGRLKGAFRDGMADASFGSHPIFELMKCARRAGEHPVVIGSMTRFAGYLWWWTSRRLPLLPAETAEFLRSEQRAKIKGELTRLINMRWVRNTYHY